VIPKKIGIEIIMKINFIKAFESPVNEGSKIISIKTFDNWL
jgi:hypothetical protein